MSWKVTLRKLLGLASPRLRSKKIRTRFQPQVETLETRALPSATVWTDLTNYSPGDTAVINGSGFTAGETVQLQVLHTDGTPNTGGGHLPWKVTDGSSAAPYLDNQGILHLPDLDGHVDGNIETTWYVNPDDSDGSTFQLTATGLTSGAIAQNTFTDGTTVTGQNLKDLNNNGLADDGGVGLTGVTISVYKDDKNSGVVGAWDAGDSLEGTATYAGDGFNWTYTTSGANATYFLVATPPAGYTAKAAIPETNSGDGAAASAVAGHPDQIKIEADPGSVSSNGNIFLFTQNNQSPTITSNGGGTSANLSIPENTTAVTTVTATDPDSGQTLTFSLSGGADQSKFTINSSTGALAFITAPNFEIPTDANSDNVYVVVVQVLDGHGGTDTQTINVTVTDVDEGAPTITSNGGGTSANLSIPENTTAVTTVTATDPDTAQTLTFSLSGGADQSKFTINASTGVLAFITAPNFEIPTDANSDNIYVVVVKVADGHGGIDTQTINVTVTDVDEGAPTITSNGGGTTANLSIPENTTAVTTVTATDPDTAQTLTFSLNGGADQSKFTINSSTGVLAFITAPDFENPTDANSDNEYVVVVQVSDGHGGTDTQTINVTVTDVDEGGPTITSNDGVSSANLSIPENTTAVTTVTATDPDTAQTLTFSLSGGADQSKFTINSSTRVLAFITASDFENPADANSDNVYVVVVQVSDGHGGTDTQTINVTVTDVLEDQAPIVTQNPVNQTVIANDVVSFTAAATGVATPTVQWQVSPTGVGGSYADIPGANSTTLSFAAVPGDTGKYFLARFTNGTGSADTSAATLIVASKLAFATSPPANVAAGVPFSVVVQLQDQNGNPVLLSGVTITLSLSPGSTLGTGITNASGQVTFTNLVLNTPGSFTLKASNPNLTDALAGIDVIDFSIGSADPVVVGPQLGRRWR